MKPTTDGRWAHLACAIWIPGFYGFLQCTNRPVLLGYKTLGLFIYFVQKHVYQMLKKWNLLMGFLELIRYLHCNFSRFGNVLFYISPS